MNLHKLLSQVCILMLAKLLTEGRGNSESTSPSIVVDICTQQPIAESVTCRSTQWLQWMVTFGSSLALSDVTMQYISSDPVGRTRVATRDGLNFTFNLTVNNQSQLVSVMMVTNINTIINITVHCGQDITHLSWIAVQDPPGSPVISNKSIIVGSGDNHGIAVVLEWASSDATMVDDYIINVSPPIASTSMFITANTSIQLFMLYNQEYNITIVATSCAGNSTPMETGVKIGYCAPPIIVESNVTVVGNISGLEGSMITYYCQQTGDDPPVEPMVAVCTRDGYWSPNPSELECSLTHATTVSMDETSSSLSARTDQTNQMHSGSLVLLTSTLLVGVLLFTVIVVVFTMTAFVVYWKVCNRKIVDESPKMNPLLPERNGEEAQIHNSIVLQEQGIYSLLQAESENQLNDSEKKQAPGQLIYADIGNSVDTHGQPAAPISMPYPSLSLQLDDSQVQYADIKPHQSTTNHDMVVDTEAGTASPTATFLSDDSLDLDTLLIQLRSEVTHKWRDFGLAVGLTEELLDKYSAYPPEECIVEVLDVWLRNYDHSDSDTSNIMTRKPTWWDVAKALREIELHQLANNILSKYKNGEISLEIESDIMDTIPKQRNSHSNDTLADDDLPPPLPPKMIDFDEEMESPPQQEELGSEETPPPLPPPYKETSLKQMFSSSVPPIPPKNNLQT